MVALGHTLKVARGHFETGVIRLGVGGSGKCDEKHDKGELHDRLREILGFFDLADRKPSSRV
jgi:hypothetical protein